MIGIKKKKNRTQRKRYIHTKNGCKVRRECPEISEFQATLLVGSVLGEAMLGGTWPSLSSRRCVRQASVSCRREQMLVALLATSYEAQYGQEYATRAHHTPNTRLSKYRNQCTFGNTRIYYLLVASSAFCYIAENRALRACPPSPSPPPLPPSPPTTDCLGL